MRKLALILLLFILIVICAVASGQYTGPKGRSSKRVRQSTGPKGQPSKRVGPSGRKACGKPKRSCKKKGKKQGVKPYCLRNDDGASCTGEFFTDKKYCKKPNAKACGCCVPSSDGPKPKPASNVKSAFILTNHIYNDSLINPNSSYYQTLFQEVKESVWAKIKKKVKKFEPEFFRNGSVIDSTGKSLSLIVDSTVALKYPLPPQKAEKKVKTVMQRSGVAYLDTSSVQVGVRLCVAGYNGYKACDDMIKETKLNIICVQARDRSQCLQWVNSGEADAVRADPEDMFQASERFGDTLNAVVKIKDQDKENEECSDCIVAVVRRSSNINSLSDLKGKNPCFTDYGKTDGWFAPISKMLEQGDLKCSGDGSVAEQNLNVVSSYFDDACLPGKWAPDTETNEKLKSEYLKMCDLCDDPNKCKNSDDVAGYDGSLKCLTSNGNADVTWTTLDAVQSAGPSVSNSDFGFLCPDGNIKDLKSPNPCCWAKKPWPGYLIRANDENKDIIDARLKNAMNDAQNPMKPWAKDLLGITEKSVITKIDPTISPKFYLEECGYYTTISNPGCDGEILEWCVIDENERNKCNELKQVLKSHRVRPLFDCIETEGEDCMETIANGDADFVSLDGGDVFTGYREEETTPIISEVYGEYAASYFAVAVVRADTTINSLADLQGKDSCHTGISKTSGWNMPLINLINASLINGAECEFPKQMGNFFAKSCAPGALSDSYDPNGDNPDSLCELCIGNGENPSGPANPDYCVRDSNELFYGYTGAFRCLVQDAGNVAFVKHTTVSDSIDDCGQDEDWCKNINSNDYLLLCPEGGKKPVEQYKDCTLGNVPSHMVVTKYEATDELKEDIRILLLTASDILPPGNDVFVLFGDYGAYSDALFKGSATGLIDLSQKQFEKLKNGPYWKALTTLDDCK